MQFLAAEQFYFVSGSKSVLRISRIDGLLSVVEHAELAGEPDLQHLGDVDGVIGRLTVDDANFIFVIIQSSVVAVRAKSNNEVRRIDRVLAIPVDARERIDRSFFEEGSGLNKLKNSQKKFFKFVSGKATSIQPKIVDEVLRLFNDHGDFYFETGGGDLTKNTQSTISSPEPNEIFFWNRLMLKDVLMSTSPRSSEWILPLIQGFVAQKSLVIDGEDIAATELTLTLIARRSTKRAGTRYLRRGIDEEAAVANFVETELILNVFGHQLAFTQVRGSVPLFWSQRGYKYRPPLIIDRSMEESQPVFEEHMNGLVEQYGNPVLAVNLVNQTGRELCLAQAYLEAVLAQDSPQLSYFSFDFHYHCRALRFHRVHDLVAAMKTRLADIGFCWRDKSGELVLRQKGVVRTNCVDCLDRTNVVQGAVSQFVAITQFRRLGLISPLTEETPEALQQALQQMWADHGDAISRQYAGTDALKGDVTRSGQRKFTGLMKDGYNSASRYYLSHMRDAQRQLAMNALLAATSSAEDQAAEEEDDDDDEQESENIGRLVHETVRFVLPEGEILVGGWALVDGDNRNDLMDSILLLTRSHVYIAQYEEHSDKLTDVTTVPFREIERIELGRLGKSPRRHLRLFWHSHESGTSLQFDSWRAAKTRLFNNVAIPLKDGDEADEYVQAIAEQLRVTVGMCVQKEIPLTFVDRLQGAASTERKPSTFSGILSSAAVRLRQMKSPPGNGRKPIPHVEVEQLTPEELQSPASDERASTVPDHLQPPALMSHSQSDGLLANNQSGFVAKLSAKLKTPIWRTSAPDVSEVPSMDGVRTDPFQQYKEQILASKSLIQML